MDAAPRGIMDPVPTAEPVEVLAPGKPAMRRRLPFRIGQHVSHDCAPGTHAVVTAIQIYPCEFMVQVSWELGYDRWVAATALSSETESGQLADLPFPFGAAVLHRADGVKGIITAYGIRDRDPSVRVAWGYSHADWHELCELELAESPAPGPETPGAPVQAPAALEACPVQEPA